MIELQLVLLPSALISVAHNHYVHLMFIKPIILSPAARAAAPNPAPMIISKANRGPRFARPSATILEIITGKLHPVGGSVNKMQQSYHRSEQRTIPYRCSLDANTSTIQTTSARLKPQILLLAPPMQPNLSNSIGAGEQVI